MNTQPVKTPTINIGGHVVSNRLQAIEVLESLKQDQCLLIEKLCSLIAFFSRIEASL